MFKHRTPESDPPRRRSGLFRFFELLGRDLFSFYKAGFLLLVGLVPGLILLFCGVTGANLPLCLLGGAVAGLPGGPLLCGLLDTLLRALRDEPGYWWHTYKKAWRRNLRQSLLPGALLGLLASSWLWFILCTTGQPAPVWIALLLGGLLGSALALWFFCQLALLELPTPVLFRNSLRLLMAFLPRSLAGALLGGVYWGLFGFWLPYTVPLLLLTGVWLPSLLSLLCIYPSLEQVFRLESRIAQKHDADASS